MTSLLSLWFLKAKIGLDLNNICDFLLSGAMVSTINSLFSSVLQEFFPNHFMMTGRAPEIGSASGSGCGTATGTGIGTGSKTDSGSYDGQTPPDRPESGQASSGSALGTQTPATPIGTAVNQTLPSFDTVLSSGHLKDGLLEKLREHYSQNYLISHPFASTARNKGHSYSVDDHNTLCHLLLISNYHPFVKYVRIKYYNNRDPDYIYSGKITKTMVEYLQELIYKGA